MADKFQGRLDGKCHYIIIIYYVHIIIIRTTHFHVRHKMLFLVFYIKHVMIYIKRKTGFKKNETIGNPTTITSQRDERALLIS